MTAASGVDRRPLAIAMMIETVGLGGAEQVVYQLSDELRTRGHTVHPVVPAGHEGWLLDRFREGGFTWQTYSGRGIDLGLPGRLAATLQPLGVDALHSHEFVMAVFGTAAARRMGRPHVITMHGNQQMTQRFRRRVALRWAFRRSRATVAVSGDTQRHLEGTLGLAPGVVEVIRNGIPIRPGDRRATRQALGLAEDDVMLLSVGSLVPRKGHAVLLRALKTIEAGAGSWHLYIAGQGEERVPLEALAAELGLAERVHLLGGRNDIPDLQAAADLFVMPSLWEGLPLAILEAMFAANPIIASEASGIPEAITHDQHGLLTPPGDVPALATALHRLMTSPGERARLGAAARARADAEFTIGAMTDRYERLYYPD